MSSRGERSGAESLSFGVWLHRRRRALDLTQVELARRVGYAEATIRRIEADELRPSKELATRLAEPLELAPEERNAFVRFARGGGRVPDLPALPGTGPDLERGEPSAGSTVPLTSRVEATAQGRGLSACAEPPHGVAPRHNLPAQLTSFIGRESELAEIADCLADGARVRLLTLTGTGGCGKTRLALQGGAALVPFYPDGVWLVELASLGDPDLVAPTVAATLGIQNPANRPVLAHLVAALGARRLLLLLDNCEHLIDVCASLAAELIQSCPHLRILTTSRELLRVPGEIPWRVPSLEVPDLQALGAAPSTDVALVGQTEAVQLFVERAVVAAPRFALTERNARALAEICQRLDGIPLAIELAASRMAVLSIEQIAARLDQRFRLLTGGSRTAVRRQQTLRAAIDWSYDLLSEEERIVLQRSAVFAGGFRLEAAESVCSAGEAPTPNAGLQISSEDVLDLLGRLVAKSLVIVDDTGEEACYRLLETIRQYALEKLLGSGDAEAVRDRHRDWYLNLAERAEPHFTAADQMAWLDRCDGERDNFRAALAWCWDRQRTDLGMRLGAALCWLWYVRAGAQDALGWLARVQASVEEPVAPLLRAKALGVAGFFATWRGRSALAQNLFREFQTVCSQTGDRPTLARYHWAIGRAALFRGNFGQARDLFAEGVSLTQQAGDQWALAQEIEGLGWLAKSEGNLTEAHRLCAESLVHFRSCEDWRAVAWALYLLGSISCRQGDYAAARQYLGEDLAINRRLRDRRLISVALRELSDVVRNQGDHEQARTVLEEGLQLSRQIGETRLEGTILGALGWLARCDGHREQARFLIHTGITTFGNVIDIEDTGNLFVVSGVVATENARNQVAVRLFGWVKAIGFDPQLLPLDIRLAYTQSVSALREALGDATFEAAWAEGQAMTREQAIAHALSDDNPEG